MSDVRSFPSGDKRAGESCCDFDRKEENHWITVWSNSMVSPTLMGGIQIRQHRKKKITIFMEKDVETKYSRASSFWLLLMTSNAELKVSNNTEQRGRWEIHLLDVHADIRPRVCAVLTWWKILAGGGKMP